MVLVTSRVSASNGGPATWQRRQGASGNQPGMWEQDQTDLPNESLTGISTPGLMSFRSGVLFFGLRGVVNPKPRHQMIATPTLTRRQKPAGPNHNLWNNNGTWWFHGTFHLADGTAQRARLSLGTRDIEVARRKRDRLIKAMDQK